VKNKFFTRKFEPAAQSLQAVKKGHGYYDEKFQKSSYCYRFPYVNKCIRTGSSGLHK